MKAWYVTDKNGYADYAVIVFAETHGKAVSLAIGTEEFPKYDWNFTELRARREPALDGAYRGAWRMEWENDDDRLAMVRWGGYHCGDDVFDPDDCEHCVAKDDCSRYEEYLEEEKEDISLCDKCSAKNMLCTDENNKIVNACDVCPMLH